MTRKTTKKTAIDHAAITMFTGKGFAATTIKDIARAAGVTEGALYRYYGSKEHMAQSLFEKELLSLVTQLLAAYHSQNRPVLKLRAVIETLYTIYKERPLPLLFVIFNFQGLKGGGVLFNQKNLYDFIIQYCHELIETLPDDNGRELLPTVLNGMVVQPVIYHYYNQLPRQPLEYLDEIVNNSLKLMDIKR